MSGISAKMQQNISSNTVKLNVLLYLKSFGKMRKVIKLRSVKRLNLKKQ